MQSMQLTDWLVVLLILAIVGVLVDGVRRKLNERRTRVVMKLEGRCHAPVGEKLVFR